VRDFGRRAAFAVVAIPIAVAIVWRGSTLFALLIALIAGLAGWEFCRLANAKGLRALTGATVFVSAAIPLVVHANYQGWTRIPLAAGALAILVIFASALWVRQAERPLAVVGACVFGALYCGGMISYAYAIRYHNFIIDARAGTLLMGLPLLMTWATDTGGYVFGRAFGRKKLMPTVSPGKTVVGAFGGVILATTVAALYITFALRPYAHLTTSLAGIIAFGVVVSGSAILGDLAESMLKREAGVKDSSQIIPGHGGVLDRFDSMFFVLPVAYVLITELFRPAL
jgi:phosphatidate cytidylyltransferase